MKSKALVLSALMLCLAMLLCSCSIKIVIDRGSDSSTAPSETVVTEPQSETETLSQASTALTQPSAQEADSPTQPSTPPASAKEISVKRAMSAYNKATSKVKEEKLGFTKAEWQDFNNIKTADPSGLVNNILTVVSKNIVKNLKSGYLNAQKVVAPSSAQVISDFPVYGQEYSVNYDSLDFIKEARMVKNDSSNTYYVYFNDVFNPDVNTPGFAGVMSPFDRNEIIEAIKQYVPVVDQSVLKLDCNYTGCYMVFEVEHYTGRLLELQQHCFVNIEATAELNLVIINTNFLNGSCTFESHALYTNFTK